ncbi:branched-chain amino acid ABC transporter permease [Azospirillum rugosum]|uniref:Branched-chain amino acid transport system permease protein n=1 Tax=Azospirillum rugosum TaxID=416170 RepID=A0ABS4SWA9_9PROT|nr:branched-chain amino acid ABC transporter permease [Azospirillum rugosum]MBP2296840.1 branched-chain amino acid transport system permease protein [Azospirillum rugosum]MDQ0530576.1 branched-chain amino acid transport system permease protein [Azospirillum rugosum]
MKRFLVPAALAVAYVAVPLAFGGNPYVMGLIVAALTIGGIAVAWALLGNLGGMVSFGHAAFFGVGSYTSAVLSMKLGVPPLAGLLLGGLGAAIASIATMPALRLKGPYFALAILAYAHIFQILATEMTGVTGGAGGLLSIPRFPTLLGVDLGSKTGGYVIILTIVVLSAAAYAAIRRSAWGLALKAMHDTEIATRVIGVPSTHLKAAMLALSAFITGVVGAFNAHFINFLEPDYAFSGAWTVLPIAAAIFGGYRTVWGPVIGALTIYLLDQLVFKELMPHGHQFVLGMLLVGMILLSPGGLAPILGRRLEGGQRHAHA